MYNHKRIDSKVITEFNDKKSLAFGDVYSAIYDELHIFTYRLFKETNVDAKDIVHDAFVNMWKGRQEFSSLNEIKAYLYITIRNEFKLYLRHNQYIDKYQKYALTEIEGYQIETIDVELRTYLDNVLQILPSEHAEIIRLFIEGYNIDEISEKLNKSKQTIYNKKSEAISQLKQKLPKGNMLILNILTLI